MSIIQALKLLLKLPDLSSKKWVYEQYDSQVMNDTLQTGGDAAVVRIHNTKKAVAISTDCTPRYVEADPFLGAIQAVAETFRNISAVGAKPLAITNCLNFGNPQKPEIMGQIVRAIRGITAACKALNYPVVSGNVSLYNETDGKPIQPTPAIGGVGLLTDYDFMLTSKFKNIGELVFVIGKTKGYLPCSLFYRDILKIDEAKNPPEVDLELELKNSEFIRYLAGERLITACHDVSDGGLLVSLFEMGSENLGCELQNQNLNHQKQSINADIADKFKNIFGDSNQINKFSFWFGEDQSRYVITTKPESKETLIELAKKFKIEIVEIGKTCQEFLIIDEEKIAMSELISLNCELFPAKFN